MNVILPRCDLCLAKSGTTTLQVAAFGVPMIIVYYLTPLVWHTIGRFARRFLLTTRYVGLVNVLAEYGGRSAEQGPLVAEFCPWRGPPEELGDFVIDLLAHPEKLRTQRAGLLDLVGPLDQRGASLRTAAIAMEMVGGRE